MGKKLFTVKDMALVGVLSALIFTATYFLKIGPIPTPAGPTLIKVGNILCLVGALLFGKVKGGLAAGIGSMLYDLTDPAFTASAPFTFMFFFAMAFVAGAISHSGGANGKDKKKNALGAILGALTYLSLHIGKTMVMLMLSGSGFAAALSACGVKLITSGVNAILAVSVSLALTGLFRVSLEKAHIIE